MVIGMATFGGIRALANLVSGRPVTENVAMDMAVGATAGATVGGSALLQGASSTPVRYVIGAMDDITAAGAVKAGEATLLPRLVGDLGSRAANWARNEAALRDVMAQGRPIRDASVGLLRGLREFGADRFITLERNVLRTAGWVYSRWTGTWNPPNN